MKKCDQKSLLYGYHEQKWHKNERTNACENPRFSGTFYFLLQTTYNLETYTHSSTGTLVSNNNDEIGSIGFEHNWFAVVLFPFLIIDSKDLRKLLVLKWRVKNHLYYRLPWLEKDGEERGHCMRPVLRCMGVRERVKAILVAVMKIYWI